MIQSWLRKRPPTGSWTVFSFTVVWVLGVVVPMLGVMLLSFMHASVNHIDFTPTLSAYADVLTSGRWEVTTRTIRIALVVTGVQLVLGFPFALWLAKGARSLTLQVATWTLLTAPFFLSAAARTIVWRPVLGLYGLVNTELMHLGITHAPVTWLLFSEPAVHFGLFAPYFPNMVWPIFLAIILIDDELIQASKDLGGSPADTFRLVILPLSMPGVVAGFVFTFVPMLGDHVVTKLLGGEQVQMLGTAMFDLITAMNYTVAAAMSTVVLLIMLLLFGAFWLLMRPLGGVAVIFQGLKR
ncbi:MAG: ABC transporter permease [Arenicellales bacterium]